MMCNGVRGALAAGVIAKCKTRNPEHHEDAENITAPHFFASSPSSLFEAAKRMPKAMRVCEHQLECDLVGQLSH